MMPFYLLAGTEVVSTDDMREWAHWFERTDRHIAATEVAEGVRVSTVFLGVDHGWGDTAPVLFETMVFGGLLDGEIERYTTYHAAEQGHEAMIERVRQAMATQ